MYRKRYEPFINKIFRSSASWRISDRADGCKIRLMYYVYVIYNQVAHKFYIGQTQNLKERPVLHNKGVFKGYTSRFQDEWKLIYSESVTTRSEALKREKQLKSFRGREFVKQYIPA